MIVGWITIETPETVNIVLGFFSKGGLFMWPLLACSIVSVTIMILRGLALRRNKVMPPLIENEIERLTPGESPERLSRIVHHDGSSLARIARVALQYLRGPRSENVKQCKHVPVTRWCVWKKVLSFSKSSWALRHYSA